MDAKGTEKSPPPSPQKKGRPWAVPVIEAAEQEKYPEVTRLIQKTESSLTSPEDAFDAMPVLFSKQDGKKYVISPYYQQISDSKTLHRLYDLAGKVSKYLLPQEDDGFKKDPPTKAGKALLMENKRRLPELHKMILAVLPTKKINDDKQRDMAYCAYRFFLDVFIWNIKRDSQLFDAFSNRAKSFNINNGDAEESEAAKAFSKIWLGVQKQFKGDKRERINKVLESPGRAKTRKALVGFSWLVFPLMAVGEWLFWLKNKIGEAYFPGKKLNHIFFRGIGYLYKFVFYPQNLIKTFPRAAKYIRFGNLVAWVAIIYLLTPMLMIPASAIPLFAPLFGISKQQLFMMGLTFIGVGLSLLLRWVEARMPQQHTPRPANRKVSMKPEFEGEGGVLVRKGTLSAPKSEPWIMPNSRKPSLAAQEEAKKAAEDAVAVSSQSSQTTTASPSKSSASYAKLPPPTKGSALASFEEQEADVSEDTPLLPQSSSTQHTSEAPANTDMFRTRSSSGAATPELEREGDSHASAGSKSRSDSERSVDDGRLYLGDSPAEEGDNNFNFEPI